MSLDNFRSDFRKIDKINQSYIEPLYAKQGDYNGRDLIVQITDGGEVKDQTGVTLNLGWKHESVGNSGLEPFERVDATQGIFKVSYPTELLNPGRVTGVIQIIEGGKIGYTFNVKIVVDKNPVDENDVVSDNAFTVLQDALTTVIHLDERLDNIASGTTQDSEVIDARFSNVTGNSFANLGSRLDNFDERVIFFESTITFQNDVWEV